MFSFINSASATREFNLLDCTNLQEAWDQLNEHFVESVERSASGKVISAILLDDCRGKQPLDVGSKTELIRQTDYSDRQKVLFVSHASTPPTRVSFTIEEQFVGAMKQEAVFEFLQEEAGGKVKLAITLNSSEPTPPIFCVPCYIDYMVCLKGRLQERVDEKIRFLAAAVKKTMGSASPVVQSRKQPLMPRESIQQHLISTRIPPILSSGAPAAPMVAMQRQLSDPGVNE